MNRTFVRIMGGCAAAVFVACQSVASTMSFTVSMERPTTHCYHVVFRCDGLTSGTNDFKMPVWTPGYYQIVNYSRNVLNFQAADGAGKALDWEKAAKNVWRVRSGGAPVVIVSYDVYAQSPAIAESYLDDQRGYISPAGIFLHVAGEIKHPVTVTVNPFTGWSGVATGLDPVPGRTNTFSAPDFDLLYDSPILAGNLEVLRFEVNGVPHAFAGYDLGSFDRERFVSDLRRMVDSAVSLMGDIPYRHYTFLAATSGQGGIEHGNSSALSFKGSSIAADDGNKRWLGFVAHEFFHLYNVKRIRPIELGPFDYDRENYTRMLWVSEGFTVYYEWVILRRAGLISGDDVIEDLGSSIANYETKPGRLYQSAADASFDTWLVQPFGRSENVANTTISYYDKGAVLGALLDFKIRHETQNRKSLDDVMRELYRRYYRQLGRGFTEQEFRAVCEGISGCSLDEIFRYANTVEPVDYRKYLAYAGLEFEPSKSTKAKAYVGIAAREQDGKLVISNIEPDSPASRAGLSVQDELISVDGERLTSDRLNELRNAYKPGDKLRISFSRRNRVGELEVVLAEKDEPSFRIRRMANPDSLQGTIQNDWLRER